jgi:hypothetical protein
MKRMSVLALLLNIVLASRAYTEANAASPKRAKVPAMITRCGHGPDRAPEEEPDRVDAPTLQALPL